MYSKALSSARSGGGNSLITGNSLSNAHTSMLATARSHTSVKRDAVTGSLSLLIAMTCTRSATPLSAAYTDVRATSEAVALRLMSPNVDFFPS